MDGARDGVKRESCSAQVAGLEDKFLHKGKPLRKVAFLRVGALGDLLVGLAALREMERFFPTASVVVIGPKLWTEILDPASWPQIESLAVIERKGQVASLWERKGSGWEAGAKMPLVDVLRSCDGLVNTNVDSYRYGFTALRARVPVKVGSAPASMAWLYTHASPFFGKDPLLHERDVPLLMLEYASDSGAKFFRTTERNRANLTDWVERSRLVERWRHEGLPPAKTPDLDRARELAKREPGSYVLVNPTSSRREKAWPAESFRELLSSSRAVLKERGVTALVVGSPTETDWLREVAGEEFEVVQPPTVRDLQDLLSGSRGLVTNTSSVQFIAAMTGTPTVTLMGRARPEIWGPLGPRDSIVEGQPPRHLDHDIFMQEREGYRSIAVDRVRDSFWRLLEIKRVR